jgi:mannan endo-1,4-beta-mannosidase
MLASLSSLGYVMSGQHNDEKKPDVTAYTNDVQRITGKYPGLWSGDFLFEANDQRRWAVVREAENQWRNDAIINLMWHACPPTQGESCGWDGGVQSKLSDQQWNDLITDGGNLNRVWKQRMDSIAVYLQYLKEKGVEVMWRPLHEMNQGAFWWGGRPGANGTRRLYQLTHDYMVDQKGLTNLIWVWNVQDLSTDYAAYNPGNAYWDVATLDVYGSGLSERSYYDALMQQVGNKIVGIGETFKLPTENAFKQFPRFSFFMIWAYGLENDNSRQEIINAYSNPRVITRDEITSMKRK